MYGRLLRKFDNVYIVQINEKNTAIITVNEKHNEIEFFRSGILVYTWTDTVIDSNTFSRILGRKEFIFKDNELFLFKTEKPVKFINNLKPQAEINNKFITLDIETYIKDGVHVPYCISWYDGHKEFSYFLSNYANSVDMIKFCFTDIMIKKYDNYKIYIHNMAGFDAIFLLKILADLGTIKPIIHHNDIISIQFNYKDFVVQIKDSQQMLTGSLKALGKAFAVETLKSIFPYDFVNESNLDFVGPVPNINYFKDDLTREEYSAYCDLFDNNWNLKEETIKYCNIDCKSLYQILVKFNELIFDKFNLNIHKYPTLSSLVFAIFRTNFLVSDTISQLSGQTDRDIRQSYTGGAVDMYTFSKIIMNISL